METNRPSALPVGPKLLKARWIEIVDATDGLDRTVQWTTLGMRRCIMLRHVIGNFNLAANAGAVEKFTRQCQVREKQAGAGMGDVAQDFWLSCLEELSSGGEAGPDALWRLVTMIIRGNQFSSPAFTALDLALLEWEDIFQEYDKPRRHRPESQ